MDNKESNSKVSKYNAAIAELYRLDNLWQSANYNARCGKLTQWNWDLDAIWRELGGDAKKEDLIKFYQYNKLLIKYKKSRALIYHVLEKKHIFLKKLQNKQNKGTAYADTVEDYLD